MNRTRYVTDVLRALTDGDYAVAEYAGEPIYVTPSGVRGHEYLGRGNGPWYPYIEGAEDE